MYLGDSTNNFINNISLKDIARVSQLNDAVTYQERIGFQLNDDAHNSQLNCLQKRLNDYIKRFKAALDFVQTRMLNEINRELNFMTREERYIAVIQDLSEMSDTRRTFDRGDSRRLTEAETAKKALQRNDRQIQKQPTKSAATIVKTANVFKCP